MWSWLPNALTGLRLILIVPLVMALGEARWSLALALAVTASVSDGLDGFLARRYGWQTWIGGMLDPIADKLLVLTLYSGLALHGELPWWLAAVVIGRDVVIVLGAIVYHNRIAHLKAEPSKLGKWNTVVQLGFIALMLLHLAGWIAWPESFESVLEWVVAGLTVISGLDYVVTWSKRARQAVNPDAPS